MYNLPFKEGQKIIELGGGRDNPMFRPNINIEYGVAVDIVQDFNYGIPLSEYTADGIFGGYVMEHIKNANIRRFIADTYRALKDGCYAVYLVPNLYEQAKRVVSKVESGEFKDEDIHMIFGGDPPDYWNFHHTGFSPDWAVKLFTEAGFSEVNIIEHPNCPTDMIIEARK